MLWECSVDSSTRASLMKKFRELLEDYYEDFESLDNAKKLPYLLGSKLWESLMGCLARLRNILCRHVVNRKNKLYLRMIVKSAQQLHS